VYKRRVASALGRGNHALAPLSFKAASYSGIFTLLPLLTGKARAHHGAILAEAAKLAEAEQPLPCLDPREFSLDTAEQAYAALADRTATGKLVVSIA
jgi:NADPH:quinone reductase-like Zn-dependent oxidoreductase